MNGFKKSPSLDSVLSYFVLRTNDILELLSEGLMSDEKSAGPKGKELAISDLTLFDTPEKPSFFIIRARGPGAARTLTGAGARAGAAACIATGGDTCIGAFIGICIGACIGICIGICIGACITTGAGACIGICIGACITTGGGACIGICIGACITTGAAGAAAAVIVTGFQANVSTVGL